MAAAAHVIFCSAGVSVLSGTCAQIIGARQSDRTAIAKFFISFPFCFELRPRPRGVRRATAGYMPTRLARLRVLLDLCGVDYARSVNLRGMGIASEKARRSR